MATALHSPLPSNPSTPPTPSSAFPAALARLRENALERNASTSSSRSTQTTSSTTSSLEAVPIRPPPAKTSTAATSHSQFPSRPSSASGVSNAGGGGAGGGGALGFGGSISTHGLGYSGGGGASGSTTPYGSPEYHSPSAIYGGRNFQRNGPRMGGVGANRQGSIPLPSIITSDTPTRAASVPLPDPSLGPGRSPTTPRAGRFLDPDELEVGGSGSSLRPHRMSGSTIGGGGSPNLNLRGSFPSSPTAEYGSGYANMKGRALSAGTRDHSRERRQSVASARSSGSGRAKESPSDYIFGEELGRGSYSTVVQAVRASSSNNSPTSPRPPKQFAIKIINQAHLVQEKKTKYAMIERDALVRLNAPRTNASPGSNASPNLGNTSGNRGHRRGLSNSSSGGGTTANANVRKNRSSSSLHSSQTATGGTSSNAGPATGYGGGYGQNRRNSVAADRMSINTSLSDSTSSGGTTFGSSAPLSPTLTASLAGRRPSRSADPPESVPERSEDGHTEVLIRSRPPSPVREDSREHILDAATTPPSKGSRKAEDPTQPADFAETPRTPMASALPQTPSSTSTARDTLQQQQQQSIAESRERATSVPPVLGSIEKREARRSNDREAASQSQPRSRRASKAPSERSNRSLSAKCHPGIIRLFSTFNDATSLYFVLDMAANGELLVFLRKYGSFNLDSARYYAALILDTVEFMHERGVVHRDLKPENILLDDDMRVKITDFGSAKLLDADAGPEEGKKRSFVGSADFVSPEVLRNEPASSASDIWAFGCIVYQLFVGKPPFRGATDYLTFQKILKKDMEFPEDFDAEAKDLIEAILDLDPASRPTATDLKSRPFFNSIDWSAVWSAQVPMIQTGITPPVATLANVDPQSDMWAVFDDEVSDGGYEDDDAASPTEQAQLSRAASTRAHNRQLSAEYPHRWSPQYDHLAAAEAVRSVDLVDSPLRARMQADEERERESDAVVDTELDPPRPGWMDSVRKKRGFSRGSARTSSSSSANRTALTGLLESMGIPNLAQGSGRTSRTSMKSDEPKPFLGASAREQGYNQGQTQSQGPGQGQGQGQGQGGSEGRLRLSGLGAKNMNKDVENGKWSSLLLANENVVFTSPVTVRTSSLPAFLAPNATKRRQLILTDFPRLFAVKEDAPAASGALTAAFGSGQSPAGSASQTSGLSVKNECIIVPRPSTASAISGGSAGTTAVGGSGGANRVMDVVDKGAKGFVVQTSSQSLTYLVDTMELRNEWVEAIKKYSA